MCVCVCLCLCVCVIMCAPGRQPSRGRTPECLDAPAPRSSASSSRLPTAATYCPTAFHECLSLCVYVRACVCVRVCVTHIHIHAHTHTHIYIYCPTAHLRHGRKWERESAGEQERGSGCNKRAPLSPSLSPLRPSPTCASSNRRASDSSNGRATEHDQFIPPPPPPPPLPALESARVPRSSCSPSPAGSCPTFNAGTTFAARLASLSRLR